MKKDTPPGDVQDTIAREHAAVMAKIEADPQALAALQMLKDAKARQPVYPLPITALEDAAEALRDSERKPAPAAKDGHITQQMPFKKPVLAPGLKELQENGRRTSPMLSPDEARAARETLQHVENDVEKELPAARPDTLTAPRLAAVETTEAPSLESTSAKRVDQTSRSLRPIILTVGGVVAIGAVVWWVSNRPASEPSTVAKGPVSAAIASAPTVPTPATATATVSAAAPSSAPTVPAESVTPPPPSATPKASTQDRPATPPPVVHSADVPPSAPTTPTAAPSGGKFDPNKWNIPDDRHL